MGGYFQYDGGNAFTLTGCTVTGNSAFNGAGIAMATGQLAVTNSEISNNTASIARGSSSGGGVFVEAPASAQIVGTDLSNNSANGGGAIRSAGSLTLQNCTLSGNTAPNNTYSGPNYIAFVLGSGGALDVPAGQATVSDCTFSANTATLGGAIASSPTKAQVGLTLDGCTITGNSALFESSSYFSAGEGGACFLSGSYKSHLTATLSDCTISGNTAQGSAFGGGIVINNRRNTFSGGTVDVSLDDCDVSGNTAVGPGAASTPRAGSTSPTPRSAATPRPATAAGWPPTLTPATGGSTSPT